MLAAGSSQPPIETDREDCRLAPSNVSSAAPRSPDSRALVSLGRRAGARLEAVPPDAIRVRRGYGHVGWFQLVVQVTTSPAEATR